MAEVSMETQAILDRLKAEGQLTRNSGTNSIASVNINLDKLSGLFQVVARNTIEQTSLMRSQLDQQEEAAEAQKRRDDLQEITLQKLAGKGGKPGAGSGNEGTGNEGTGSGGGFQGFGIMNLLGGMSGIGKKLLFAGVAFAVANVVRGYLDAKFDGAASEAVDSVLGKIGTFFNPENLQAQFASMQTKLGDMTAALERLTTTFNDMITKMDEIMKKIDEFSLSWDKILSTVSKLIGIGTLVTAWKAYETRMKRLNDDSVKSAQKRNRFQKQKNSLLERSLNRMRSSMGLAPLAPDGSTKSGSVPKTGTYDDAPMRQNPKGTSRLPTPPSTGSKPTVSGTAKPPAPKPAAKPPTVQTNNGAVSKAEVRADAARKLKGYSLANNGNSLRGPDGKMVSGDQALSALEKTLDPKYSKIFRRISKFVRLTGWGALLVMMFEVAMILADPNMSDDKKKKALARIFLVGASAALFATAGAIMGSVVPGWGTLIGGLAGGIGGYFAADYVMDSIIEALWSGGNPEQKKIREMEKMSKQSEMNYMGSEQGQRAKSLAVAEARAGAGYRGPIDSGGNPMDSVPDDIKAILSGSKRNYFTAGDGTMYGTVPGSGQNIRAEMIAPNSTFVESQLKTAVQGAAAGMSPTVVNNVGGPTYQTIMNSRAGDTNVADIKQYNGTGDANPMSLASGG